jgi:hypothetical protein
LLALAQISFADQQPLVNRVSLSGNSLGLAWTGNSTSYQLQITTNLTAPDWIPVLETARTNASVPVVAKAAFFRVVPPSTNQGSVVLTITNLSTGDWDIFTNVPQSNGDLLFDGMTNGTSVQDIIDFPASELEKFDVAFDGQGGFTLVTNSHALSWGGTVSSTQGPGPNEITYTGIATNSVASYSFTAVTDPDDWGVFGGLIGAMNWLYCLPGFAGSHLGCTGNCVNQAVICAFQLKASYCTYVETIDGSGLLTNGPPICNATCQTGCK